MERKNIAAFTESTPDLAYVSIIRDPEGRYTITARERGHDGNKMVTMEIPEADLQRLGEEITDRIGDVAIDAVTEV